MVGSTKLFSTPGLAGSLSDVRRALCCDGPVSPDSVILVQGGEEADLSISALEAKRRTRQGLPLFYLVKAKREAPSSVLEVTVRMGVTRETITIPCTERVDDLARRLGAAKLIFRGNNVLNLSSSSCIGDWVLSLCAGKGPLQLLALPTPALPAPALPPLLAAATATATAQPGKSSKICKVPPRARSCTSRFKGLQTHQRGRRRGGNQPCASRPLDFDLSPLSSPYSSPTAKAR